MSTACAQNSDCFSSEGQYKDVYTDNKCNDQYGNCFCDGGKCTSTTCTENAQCQALFGASCNCADTGMGYSMCTKTCDTTADCPTNMKCNGQVCTTQTCTSNGECGKYSKCKNGYCVYPEIPNIYLVLFLVLVAIALVIAYMVIKKHKAN